MLGRWLAIIAVLLIAGVGVASRIDWGDRGSPEDGTGELTGADRGEVPDTPDPGSGDYRRTNAELQARVRELEAELAAAQKPALPPADGLPAHPRPAFQSDLTSDGRAARFLTFDQLTSLEKSNYRPGELILQLEDGGRGRLRLAGRAPGAPLTPELRRISEAFLLNRYDLDLLTRSYVVDELDRGRYEPFAEDALAYEYARRTFDDLGSDCEIEYVEGEYRVVDLRPLRQESQYLDLQDEFQRLRREAKRIDPVIVGPVMSLSW